MRESPTMLAAEKVMTIKEVHTGCAYLILSASLLIAPGIAGAATYVTPTAINSVSIYAGVSANGAYISINPALANGTEGCTYTPANLLWIDFSSTVQPDGKALYASVLAAILAGKQVNFGVAGCGDAGQLPLVYRVDVIP